MGDDHLDGLGVEVPSRIAARCVASIALTLSVVACFPGEIRAETISSTGIEVYPGPGVDTYRSSLYGVEVFDGSAWLPSYVYQYSRKSFTHWHRGTSPSVSFSTFGTTRPLDVRVTRIEGSITLVDVSPKSKHIPVRLSNGRAILTLDPNAKAWVTINGDDANPLFIFADPPKPAPPAGATYFGPGIVDISPATGNHYYAKANDVIYLDGGAWVRGNIDVSAADNVQIMGPGVLSGDLWIAETIQALSFNDGINYAMIKGDYATHRATVQGITIVDSPIYNISGGAKDATNVKLLSPWYFQTDGFPNVDNVDQAFAFVGDNVFHPTWAGRTQYNVTIRNSFGASTGNAVFLGGFFGNTDALKSPYTALVDNIDVRSYNGDEWVPYGSPLTPAAFQIWVDNSDSTKGYANQTYQNIRIEGNIDVPLAQLTNRVYPWPGNPAPDPPLGNSYNLVFKNISLAGTQKYLSEIKGWDLYNGFHRVILDNVRINGTVVTPSNVASYFDVNSYVWGLGYTTAAANLFTLTPCRLVDTRNPNGPLGGPALGAGQDRVFAVGGQCGLPSGAKAISVNVTATQPSGAGYLTLYSGGTVRPLASSLNYGAGQTRANNAIVALGPTGEIVVHCDQPVGTTHFVLDVNAYFQ